MTDINTIHRRKYSVIRFKKEFLSYDTSTQSDILEMIHEWINAQSDVSNSDRNLASFLNNQRSNLDPTNYNSLSNKTSSLWGELFRNHAPNSLLFEKYISFLLNFGVIGEDLR
jgi:hypothetical protein